MNRFACVVLLLAFLSNRSAPAQEAAAGGSAAPKVILMIGDGMDQQQITIARDYLAGYAGRLTLDTLSVRSSVQIQTLAEEDPSMPEYVADSANTATSMATGIVTSAGRIATTAGTDLDVATIMELAAAAGRGTGIVTTSSVTDATPASFVAHVSFRLCESPRTTVPADANSNAARSGQCPADLKANGGKGSIAEQIAASRIDIVLGGGERYFAQVAEGEKNKTVRDLAAANGFRVVGTATELASVKRGGKVLGLFAPVTMPVQWRGAGGAQAQRVAHDENGRVVLPEPFACEPDPAYGTTPPLPSMARAALAHLDGRSFMLMIESASIDKQSHVRRPCGQIGEVKQLDDTLKLVLEYAAAHPETLVLVTADHSQAAQLVPETSVLAGFNAASPGYFARVRTPEGAIMGVNYATNDSEIQEDHTGADVPLLAYGAKANEIPPTVRQADIFQIMLRHLGLAAASASQ